MLIELKMRRGDTKRWHITIADENGPLPLDGRDLFFTARKKYTDAAAVVEKVNGAGIEVLAETGEVILQLNPADTASLPAVKTRLVCDLQLVEEGVVTTLLPDDDFDFALTVHPDVTVRTTP